MLAVVFTVLVTALLSTSNAMIPHFSWDSLPVFFHSANTSGPYSDKTVRDIARYSMVTFGKAQGSDVPNVDDEDEMVLAMKAIKQANPNVATYFYINAFKDSSKMSRMARQLKAHPEWILHDKDGKPVKNKQGFLVVDQSNPDVREYWIKTCLDAVSAADGDGCFADSSQHYNESYPNVSPLKMQEWNRGILQLSHDLQQRLGDDKLLIGKAPDQPYVKAAMIEYFRANNDSINGLIEGVRKGKVMEAHVPIFVDCNGDITDYLAAFLVGAGNYSYFGCGQWSSDDNEPWYWRPEYSYPLGEPVSAPSYNNGVWRRVFANGVLAMFDTANNKGTIRWSRV